MDNLIKEAQRRQNPEITAGLHLLKYGLIAAIPSPPSSGQTGTESEPLYSVDVQLLKDDLTPDPTAPIYESVPLPTYSTGIMRGAFGFPDIGARVLLACAYGSPQHPVIIAIYPINHVLHELGKSDQLLAVDKQNWIRGKPDKWDIRTSDKVRIGTDEVDIVAQLQSLASQVAHLANTLATHTHPESIGTVTDAPNQSGEFSAIAGNVEQIDQAVNKVKV